MPSLSYSKQTIKKYNFKNKIRNGIKIHTIRKRKTPIKQGDILYHFENWRTPAVNKFYQSKCCYLKNIIIFITKTKFPYITVFIDGKSISPVSIYLLAKNDGFDHIQDFIDFFDQGAPFSGQIIGWDKGIDYD